MSETLQPNKFLVERKDPERRIAVARVTPDLLIDLCKDGRPRMLAVKENALPKDARVYGVGVQQRVEFNPVDALIHIVIESESFEPVPLGNKCPELPATTLGTEYQNAPDDVVKLLNDVFIQLGATLDVHAAEAHHKAARELRERIKIYLESIGQW